LPCVHISYQTKLDAEAETRRKSQAGEDLSAQETTFMIGYSSQTPYSIIVRTWSLVRLLEHAHL